MGKSTVEDPINTHIKQWLIRFPLAYADEEKQPIEELLQKGFRKSHHLLPHQYPW